MPENIERKKTCTLDVAEEKSHHNARNIAKTMYLRRNRVKIKSLLCPITGDDFYS